MFGRRLELSLIRYDFKVSFVVGAAMREPDNVYFYDDFLNCTNVSIY